LVIKHILETTKDYIITLIHGTFAKDAPWVQEKSEVRNTLQNEITGNIVFDSLDWSGKNSHDARYEAAVELKQKLVTQINDYPLHEKILISHSHGGNIVLYALNMLGEDAKYFKVVTMATPFLNVRIRSFLSNLKIFKNLSYLAFGLFALVFIVMIISGIISAIMEFFGLNNENSFVIGMACSALSVPVLIFYTEGHINPKVNDFLQKIPEKINKDYLKFSFENITLKDQIFIVIDKGDEVRFFFNKLLYFWNILLNLSDKALNYSSKFFKYFIISLLPITIIAGLLSEYIKANPDSAPTGNILIYIVLAPLFFFFYFMIITPYLIFLVSFILYLIKSNPIALGWEGIGQQLFIDTSVSKTPVFKTEYIVKEYNFNRKGLLDLQHSIYNHKEVIIEIGKWIKTEKSIK